MKVGDIYWLKSDTLVSHPRVIVEINEENLYVVSLTTNMNKVGQPGNILLEIGEGGLEKQSIVEVAKSEWLNRSSLAKYIGTLSQKRVDEILQGIGFIERTYF